MDPYKRYTRHFNDDKNGTEQKKGDLSVYDYATNIELLFHIAHIALPFSFTFSSSNTLFFFLGYLFGL